MMFPVLLLLLSTAFTCQASSQKVLVLLDDLKTRSTHSLYFNDLISRGYEISFKSASDKKLQLKDWDEWLYDKIVLLAPTATGGQGALIRQPFQAVPSHFGRLLNMEHYDSFEDTKYQRPS